ncbi:hypothetical protein IQ215_00295 [Cyanobacterium stanieri LEGE 03274]|uniref:Uncharacterized protein n=1 Tax=Cyanobacterium stanieri LEGE 03274 TaxID=1828756 RepID=A0ABR9UZQ7_9CHRO|nr:hypothetical protein [Cyanobacterium stanieri]MBE9221126.1 hypothetical protein [Cyanobacterium stanieri LEGE 03274]
MEYIYFIDNASLVIRLINFLVKNPLFQESELTLVNQVNGWIIRLKAPYLLTQWQYGNLRAFLEEIGYVYHPKVKMNLVFCSLDMGEPPVKVMVDYQVAIVSHGIPTTTEIEAFRLQFAKGLGYCPETLA